MCAQSHDLDRCTKFHLEILTISAISGIVYFRKMIWESLQNISETNPLVSNNVLSAVWHQAITSTNADCLWTSPLKTNFSDICITVTSKYFLSRKCSSNCHLQHISHFVWASMCWIPHSQELFLPYSSIFPELKYFALVQEFFLVFFHTLVDMKLWTVYEDRLHLTLYMLNLFRGNKNIYLHSM